MTRKIKRFIRAQLNIKNSFLLVLIFLISFQTIIVSFKSLLNPNSHTIFYFPSTASSYDEEWELNWGGYQDDRGQGIVLDSLGNIYITGYTNSYGTGESDLFILKYDPLGTLMWERTWGGGEDEKGYGVILDDLENIYITGYSRSYGVGERDVILLKYDASGNLLWEKMWGGPQDDVGYGIAIDSTGNVFITGSVYSYGAGKSDVFLVKYDNFGNLRWNKTWGGNANDREFRSKQHPIHFPRAFFGNRNTAAVFCPIFVSGSPALPLPKANFYPHRKAIRHRH